MELRDIWYKKIVLLFRICISGTILISCDSQPDANQILKDAINAHGGVKKWESIEEISYRKTTVLYDSLGNIEKEITQHHKNSFKPSFSAEMKWMDNGISKKVTVQNEKTSIVYGDSVILDLQLKKKYYKEIMAANYVFWQPYKLLDPNLKLGYVRKENIDEKETYVLKAEYKNEDGSPGNTWWYYFDTKSYKLLGNMVYHAPTYSYIRNVAYEDQTGLLLNAKRISYRVDSLRNIKYTRATYTYEILEIK